MSIEQILKGHISPETAYVVNDYPYGFKQRCKIRYWIEHDPKKGSRFCSQTTNPKKSMILLGGQEVDVWNKPKKSTYCELAAAMYLDEKGYVNWNGLTQYDRAASCTLWMKRFEETLPVSVAERVWDWIMAWRIEDNDRNQ